MCPDPYNRFDPTGYTSCVLISYEYVLTNRLTLFSPSTLYNLLYFLALPYVSFKTMVLRTEYHSADVLSTQSPTYGNLHSSFHAESHRMRYPQILVGLVL